jgi:hypothetical protein
MEGFWRFFKYPPKPNFTWKMRGARKMDQARRLAAGYEKQCQLLQRYWAMIIRNRGRINS